MEEIEVKFFIDSKDNFRKKLSSIGAQKISDEFLMKRKIYERVGAPPGDWFRVRQEHDKITLTFKSKRDHTIDGMLEYEVNVSDFDECVKILEQAGLTFVTYQENYREAWIMDEVEIVIDTWPWLPPHTEIEGPNKEIVIETAKKLGFDMHDAHYGTPLELYATIYNISVQDFNTVKEFKLENPMPEILQKNKKNLS